MYAMAYAWSQKGIAYMVSSCGKTVAHEELYISRFEDEFGQVNSKQLPRPAIAHFVYEFLPLIDEHNKARQNGLALEKVWLTKNPWTRILITLLGMAVVDVMRWDRAMRVKHVTGLENLVDFVDDDEDDFMVVKDHGVIQIADLIGKPLRNGLFKYREGEQPTARMTTQASYCVHVFIHLCMASHNSSATQFRLKRK